MTAAPCTTEDAGHRAPSTHHGIPATHAPWRAAAVERIVRTVVPRSRVPMAVELPDGTLLCSANPGGSGAAIPLLRVRSDRLFHRLATAGKVGLGESYMAGEWDAEDLPGALTALARLTDAIPVGAWRTVRRLAGAEVPSEPNTLGGARRNIRHHYDLSNELFSLFLDESMTYSAAAFGPGDDLERAQARKRRLLLDDLRLDADDHLLEIGTGWGAMAIDAARLTGARVTTITLSREQADYTRRVVTEAGLDDLIEVRVCDYREIEGRFDAIVSVEMLEAVGRGWWPTYFSRIEQLLVPGGRAALQTITMTHAGWQAADGGYGWIHRYIFPGGEIPSLEALRDPVTDAGLRIAGRRDLGRSYVDTLVAWRHRFLERLPEVRALGFDATFARMWEFYLAYCEAGFRVERLGVSQLLLQRALEPATVRDRDQNDHHHHHDGQD